MDNDFKIFSYAGFSKDKKPYWSINDRDQVTKQDVVFNTPITLEFDTDIRYCTGWHNLETSEDNVCAEHQQLEHKYHQCQKCQAKAGFNPAFYNADSVSEVQQKRNSEPHFVYLAYFDDNFTKVGISYQGRGIARLLEQGAKAAIILDTFNSALVARRYEAEISRLSNFVENVKIDKKLDLLNQPYNADKAKQSLEAALKDIKERLNFEFSNHQFLDLYDNYFSLDFDRDKLCQIINVSDQHKITGTIVGFYGSILLCQYQDDILALPIKKFAGYKFDQKAEIGTIELPTQQFSLF